MQTMLRALKRGGGELVWVSAPLLRTRLAGAGQMDGFPGLLAKSLRNPSVIKSVCLGCGASASLPRSSPKRQPVVDHTNEPIRQAFD